MCMFGHAATEIDIAFAESCAPSACLVRLRGLIHVHTVGLSRPAPSSLMLTPFNVPLTLSPLQLKTKKRTIFSVFL